MRWATVAFGVLDGAALGAAGDKDNQALEAFGRAERLRVAAGGDGHGRGRRVPPLGINDATFYVWKKKYANLGASELRVLRQLREESAKRKPLVAGLSLDREILGECIQRVCRRPTRKHGLVEWARHAGTNLGRACRLVQISRSLYG